MYYQKPIIFCCLLLAVLSVRGQQVTIEGVSKNTPDPVIAVMLPVEGKQFDGANNRIMMDTLSGTFKQQFSISQPGFLTLTNAWNKVQLFVSPGKAYTITADGKQVTVKGDQQEGQDLLRSLALEDDTRNMAAQLDSITTATGRVNKARSIAAEKKAAVARLYQAGKINTAFSKALNAAIDRYYVDLLSTNFYFEYRKHEQDPAATKVFRTTYLPVWKKLYEAPFSFASLLAAPDYLSVLGRYKGYREIADSGRLVFGNGRNYNMENIDYFSRQLKGAALEYAWADYIVSGIRMNLYEREWKQYYDNFRKAFPQSRLTPMLGKYIDKVVAYQKAADNPQNGADFLPGYSNMKQFREVFAALKGKVTYIDLWATWCVPCREELQYSMELHDSLHDLGVQTLYISLDNEQADKKWKEMARQLPLKGLNMRVSKELHKEISSTVPNFTGIPRYIIVNKQGEVVEWDAKRPSDKLELITQLKQYL